MCELREVVPEAGTAAGLQAARALLPRPQVSGSLPLGWGSASADPACLAKSRDLSLSEEWGPLTPFGAFLLAGTGKQP